MLTNADRAEMVADLFDIVSDNPSNIVIRRGGLTLPLQTVRIARGGGAASGKVDEPGTEAILTSVVIIGPVALDIQPGDKFTLGKLLYEVVSIHPNRTVMTQAEGKMVS